MKTVAIAYSFDPIINERFKKLSREEKIRLAKKYLEEYKTDEEFLARVKKYAEEYEKTVDYFLDEWAKRQIRSDIEEEKREIYLSLRDKYYYPTKWKTEDRIAEIEETLRKNNIPYFKKVFEGIADKEMARSEVKSDIETIKGKAEHVFTWIVPDLEVDPPNEEEEEERRRRWGKGPPGRKIYPEAIFILGAIIGIFYLIRKTKYG